MSKAKEAGKKNIWARALDVDKRYIFLITILVFLPLLYPLNLPFSSTDWSKQFYNAVLNCPDNSIVLMCNNGGSFDFTPMVSCHVALTNTLLKKNCKLVCASFAENGPSVFDYMFNNWLDKSILATKTYGVDYVILPYIGGGTTGGEFAWAAIASNIRSSTGGVDYFGKPLDGFPLMQKVNSAKDVTFLTQTGSHETLNIQAVVKNIQTPYNLPLVCISGGIAHVSDSNFLATGQIKGVIEENDYASWEHLIGYAGINLKQVDVYSAVYIALPIVIVVGNIFLFLSKRKTAAEVKK